jgi:hypothetical protein
MPAEFGAGGCGFVEQLVEQQAGKDKDSRSEHQGDEVRHLITMFESAGERVKPTSNL